MLWNFHVQTICLGEFLFGLRNPANYSRNRLALRMHLSSFIGRWTTDRSKRYADRSNSLTHEVPLLTANTNEFQRVPGLEVISLN